MYKTGTHEYLRIRIGRNSLQAGLVLFSRGGVVELTFTPTQWVTVASRS
jgi:hypothetical protein